MDKQKTYILFFLLFSQFLFGQVTYTFTNCGQTGRFGPSQSQVNSAYFGTTLDGKVTSNNGIQYWTVQETGVYTFEVWGAKGGDSNYGQNHHSGGYGATMKGEFILAEGEIIKILVGQKGESGSSNACGGGGSYVANQYDIPLIIAGGGGGGNVDGQGEAGSSLTGNNGNGGGGGYWGGGGGGFYSNGGGDNHGMSFLNGGN
ncbi:MAG: hypothetical protein H8E71_00190, partial [Candidatus Marinimicrobia bacterium]|nr:hypothetical protein [Candidatus Neomarinimicrobiota bacterium]